MQTRIVQTVIICIFIIAITGLGGMIYLCRIQNDPELVSAAVKMIQTDPSSAIAAMQLLTVDGNKLAIISGITGMAVGSLATMLANTNPRKAAETTSTVDLKDDSVSMSVSGDCKK